MYQMSVKLAKFNPDPISNLDFNEFVEEGAEKFHSSFQFEPTDELGNLFVQLHSLRFKGKLTENVSYNDDLELIVYNSRASLEQIQTILSLLESNANNYKSSLLSIENYTAVFDAWFNESLSSRQLSEMFDVSHTYVPYLLKLGAIYNGYIPNFKKIEKVNSDNKAINFACAYVYQNDLLIGTESKQDIIKIVKDIAKPYLVGFQLTDKAVKANQYCSVLAIKAALKKNKLTMRSGKTSIIRDIKSVLESTDSSHVTMREYDDFHQWNNFIDPKDGHTILKSSSVIRHANWSDLVHLAKYGHENFRIDKKKAKKIVQSLNIDACDMNFGEARRDKTGKIETALKIMSLLDEDMTLSPYQMQLEFSKKAENLRIMNIEEWAS